MTLFVDADSCPRQVRSILVKASRRLSLPTVFVADRSLPDISGLPASIRMQRVAPGTDSADRWIRLQAEEHDICITRDIVLAAELVRAGCIVIDDRGNKYTSENIAERLSLRNAMADLREAGLFPDRNRPLTTRDIQQFANQLDRELTAAVKAGKHRLADEV